MAFQSIACLSATLLALATQASFAAESRARGEDSSLYLETDRDAEKLLEAARAAARAGNWRQAVEAYQRVADFSGKGGAQPLVASQADPAVYLTIQEAASRELAKLPRAALEIYREGHDAAAKPLLDAALAARDAAALAAVAQRYLATSWGDDALAALGSLAFERADYSGALTAWGRLLDAHPEPGVPLPSILARMWVCHRALGHESAAQALADELRTRHGNATLRVGGTDVPVARFLEQDVPAIVQGPLGDWPALGGDASHSRVGRGPSEVGGLAWRFPLPYAPPRAARSKDTPPPYPIALPIHATISGDRVFLADHAAVYALSIETGQPVWLFPDAPETGPAPALDETVHAVACAEGRAFARVGQTLLAFDAATGRLLWRRAFADEKPEPAIEPKPAPKAKEKEKAAEPGDGEEGGEPPPKKKGRAKGGKALGAKTTIILTPPVAAGQRVFVGYTHLGEEARASLVALDAATGQELWRTFICSRSIPAFLGLGATPAPPAVAAGTVYHATNLGTVAAVDAAAGAIRWVHRYESYPAHLRQSILERNERWASNPPVVHSALLLVAPQDASSLLAIDLVRGSLAWSAPRDGTRHVVGVEGGRVFCAGTQVIAIATLTGKRLWGLELPEAAVGRPALCPGRLLVPTEKGLYAIATADGGLTVVRTWQPIEEPGNVTVVDGAVCVASSDRIYAYGDWTATLAALDARRKKDPNDPAVPLTLGLHEAQVGAEPAALLHLEQALRLATERRDRDIAAQARAALFEAYRARGESGDPAALAKAAEYAPGPQEAASVLVTLARIHEAAGRPAEAIGALQEVIDKYGVAPSRLEGGLVVSARALACAEIARIVRQSGREAYAAVEAEATRQLAAAKAEGDLEGVVRRFPNSAAAEKAMLRILAAPKARAMEPHLKGLVSSLAMEPASAVRAEVEAKLRGLDRGGLTERAALAPRWQVQTRIALQRVQVLSLPGAPAGHIYLAMGRRSFDRAMPFDGIECRRADTGQLLWQREVAEWDTLALFSGGGIAVATFDKVAVLDPLSGLERWSAELGEATPVDLEKVEPEDPVPPPRPRPGKRRGAAPEDLPWRPWERRRSERHRIVALAGDEQAVYTALAGGEVVAFAADDGKKLWTRQLEAKVLLSRGLFVHAGKVWVCAESPGAVYGLTAKDGTGNDAIVFQRDEAAFRLPRITDRPAWVAALGYVAVDDHTVHALDLGKGRKLWESYLESSINRILASEDGKSCYVVPDVFLHNAQLVSLHPDTGKVRRRRSVLGGSLTDAVLGPDALYVAERDAENALVVQALDAVDLGERWRTAPLQLAQPSGLALGDGLLAVAGRHAGARTAILINASTGRVLGDTEPKGATELSAALVDDLLVLSTDRGILALGAVEPQALDQRIAALSARAGQGDRAALAPLAAALYQRGDEKRAIAILARALSDETLPAPDYATLKDQLNSLREALASREPATLETAYMPVPPNIDGAIDEPWRADLAARLSGPAYIDEVQGLPIPEARWRSPSDLAAVLYTGWDARNFYFAIDVTDDVHRTYTGQTDTWIGDGLIISIDCENDGGYGYRFTGKDLLLTLALTRKDERRDDEGEDEPGGEYRVRLKDDNSGAVYEVAIPWDYMGMEEPKPGFRFGFNVTVTDDDGDRAVKTISWTPGMTLDRDRTLMIRGFTPALFGKVLLTGPPPGPPPLWTPSPPQRDEGTRVYRIRPSKEK